MFCYLQDIQEPFSIDTKGQVYILYRKMKRMHVSLYLSYKIPM